MAKIELKGITKIYDGNVLAVERSNVTIEDREFCVFVGPSGCGKSTTLRMIAGLEDITGGQLLIDGEVMNDVPPRDRNIAMVFQDYALYPHMTVYDNMAYGLKIRKIDKEEIDRRVREASKILDLDTYLDRKPKALSGGQRQRLLIARALASNPGVLLFDEATSALDNETQGRVVDTLKQMKCTRLVIAHRLSTIRDCDRILYLEQGRIAEQGTYEKLLHCNGRFAQMAKRQLL